jgi:hypothetical protein
MDGGTKGSNLNELHVFDTETSTWNELSSNVCDRN